MRKLPAVEEAREIMKQGMDWSVWKWLLEKKRVRGIADKAVEALEECEANVKAGWSDDLKLAYNELVEKEDSEKRSRKHVKGTHKSGQKLDPQAKAAVAKVKEADDVAWDARWDAEDLFDEAEKKMSAGLAREGAKKALESYDLHETAIRKAEAIAKAE